MENKELDALATDILLELPQGVEVDGRTFFIQPLTLGVMALASRWIESLEIDAQMIKAAPTVECLRLAREKRTEVATLIALRTANGKGEIFSQAFPKTIKFFTKISNEDAATLLVMILQPTDTQVLMKHLGIERELNAYECAKSAKKKDRNTHIFGGVTQFGMHYEWCKELHLTPEQIVWGIGYTKLQLMLADSIKTLHFTDKELKRAIIPAHGNRNFIRGDKATAEQIKNFKGK